MAFQIRGSAHPNTKAGGSGTTVVFTSDALTQLGDLLIVGRGDNNSGPTLTGPAGWTQMPAGGIADNDVSSIKADLWYKVAGAGDVGATAYTFTSSSTVAMHGGIFAIYDDAGGTWGASPLDGSPVTTAVAVDSTSVPTAATLVTSQANELLVALASCGVIGSPTFTPPAGMNEAFDIPAGNGVTTVAWGNRAAAGSVPAQTFTISAAFDSSVTILAAFILTPSANPLRGNSALGVYRGG